MLKIIIALSVIEINPSVFLPFLLFSLFILELKGWLDSQRFAIWLPENKIVTVCSLYFLLIISKFNAVLRIAFLLPLELLRQTNRLDVLLSLRRVGDFVQSGKENVRRRLLRLQCVDASY